jgi:hypothetical protein
MQELCPTQGVGPPVPPQELVGRWSGEAFGVAWIAPSGADTHVAAKAAAWGYQEAMATITEREQAAANAELEACCQWLHSKNLRPESETLRAARRPKPPRLKEQALEAFEELIHGVNNIDVAVIRRALEQLPD